MRPRIQQITDGLPDRIAAAGGGDLLAELAYPLPATVVMEFMNVADVSPSCTDPVLADRLSPALTELAEAAPGG